MRPANNTPVLTFSHVRSGLPSPLAINSVKPLIRNGEANDKMATDVPRIN